MRVNAWGDVYPCSVDAHLGNIRERPILEIWNGEKYREYRRTLKENDLFSQCAKCCVLTNRTWNRLPKLSMTIPESARPIVQRIHRIVR
jgi:MoaA/NifB/PqqE/SkfB family radical SAM enzyme